MRTITPPEHEEGVVARTIEQQTAKLPSDTFLWLAGGSIAGSLTLKMMGRHHDALFVGQGQVRRPAHREVAAFGAEDDELEAELTPIVG